MGRKNKRRELAQNFLRSRALVLELLRLSSIGPEDIVIEIGAGGGVITAALAAAARRVIAIEKDAYLAARLRERFRGVQNVKIVEKDFMEFSSAKTIEGSTHNHKIFANIPFNLTADIVRRILYDDHPPIEAYLILQREPARKFAGVPTETLFSLFAKPLFDFAILRQLKRTDFVPVPGVDSVLLRVKRREVALLKVKEAASYRHFVEKGFRSWKPNLKTAYKRTFTYTQWKRLSRELGFPVDATPTQLSFDQWLRLFRAFKMLGRDNA